MYKGISLLLAACTALLCLSGCGKQDEKSGQVPATQYVAFGVTVANDSSDAVISTAQQSQ